MSAEKAIRLTLEQDRDYAFRIQFEETSLEPLLADEASPLGGDRGPTPSQLLLASIANCLCASLLFALRKYKNQAGTLRAEISATPSRNADGRLRIPKAFVTLQLPEGNEDYQHLERILDQFENFCTVTQSVRHGIEVEVTVKDAHGRTLLGDKSFEAGS
ncbi:peroxiredoxin [Lysobacter daejeonensis GH1-9]|uniref:Peroxiredoxin n=1 Tax=Lysobacter daejeonensis GH1-9 TaxID=1385517 RepID=A0A0A0F1M0_9GAMM|nr:OsmC family protein [Lysobacter daejeonensis]KGM55282.1 peroxiredoxin [Lysobacter daejeonensis GH1-9]